MGFGQPSRLYTALDMGRAIVREPKAFLMDEPLSNLDAKLRVEMRASLAQLHANLGVTTIYVTHDQTEAMTLGHRVAVLDGGRILQVDTPQRLYDHPVNVFVAAFIGTPSMNLAEGAIDGDEVVFGGLRVPLDPSRRPASGMNLAPVADVIVDPAAAIVGVRSFGSDPQLVGRHVAAYVEGLQGTGVAACAKHYPGHGEVTGDSHLELPTAEIDRETLFARALPPFAAAVEAGVQAVMTAHIRFPAFDEQPATISGPLVGLLRSELGFDGVVMTDALEMRAIMEYLEQRYPEPALWPEDAAERALGRLMVHRFDTNLGAAYYAARRGDGREQLDERLAQLDRLLEAQPWLTGREYGLADIAYVPWILRGLERLGLELGPALADWLERCSARPAIAQERAVVAAL